MTQEGKLRITNIVLWLAYGLALVASVHHLAWAFGGMEFDSRLGWIPALAVDCGLAAMAYAIQQKRRAKRPVWHLWIGVVVFCAISAFANLLHAAAVVSLAGVTLSILRGLESLALVKAVVLSASLPLLVVYLGEIVSSDDAEAVPVTQTDTNNVTATSHEPDKQLTNVSHEPDRTPAPVPLDIVEPEPVPVVVPLPAEADSLTDRQRQVWQLFEQGLAEKDIAARLGVSTKTVRRDKDKLNGRLG